MDIKFCHAPAVGLCCINNTVSCCCMIPNINTEYTNEKYKCKDCTIYNRYNIYDKKLGLQHLYIMLHNYCNAKCDMCDTCEPSNKKYITNYKSLLKNKDLKNIKNIVIQGGEPFLLKTELLELISYLKEKMYLNNPSWSIITNGTILNKDIMNILNENNFNIIFSIDGYKEHNNIVRKGCEYDIILNNWNTIKQKYQNCTLSINYTLHNNNVQWFYNDIIGIFDDFQTKNISINFVTYPQKISLLYLKSDNFILKKFINDKMKLKQKFPWLDIDNDFVFKIISKILKKN